MANPKMHLKILWDNCDGNDIKKCVGGLNFSAADCLQVFSTGRDSGGREGGGGKIARSECDLCLSKYLWGKLGFILKSVKILSKTLLMAKNDVKTFSLQTY
jgi:hypothetical protein